ncbi:tRNA (N(6)-L-threonylcarbamoyladenosine(37)-C(2))-methylthiotransferase MtaB [Methylogaea oryzae]|uniref:tRNA (N(6)-L-threonylcarbamoyladenosine(37)-C(2) )-methylthiotran sferase MtaB n=1 Tax=Methylogaea oryzae TaxID=1295382 RepID=A0A8D4VQG7_9GAMM|nr:tRNA (N(6)-L-threonylcarbamoyladenosine(37)-C(2))-methylthiotransferase MtaB [Methylogaea oryzae]BBL70759.1 tRNA (N(6)-L-threonylcarbamoyladenosine(37)-C(2))-methylthiotran sferase MtaB [Methylogaea oryzae]
MRVNLKTLGCRLNEAELESWARQFQQAGHAVVADSGDADVIVLNSCAVTEDAVRKSRQTLRRLHRENPEAKLVVSGCYATLHPEQAGQALGVDLLVPNADKDRLVELTQRQLNQDSAPAFATEPGESVLFRLGRQRAFVKVQDGCRYRCTFCIVTVARGEEKSRSVAEVVEEINALHRQGIPEAVLTGVHLGGYGGDLGLGLDELIRAVLAQTDIPRLRLGSLEPWDLPEGFFDLFDAPRLMPHLHLPLQSGSDAVLRRMARRCKTDEFAALVEQARARVPDINISTDIIVGFPGETEEEWAETLAFVRRIGFGHIHIFSYSPRQGTKAAALPDHVGDAVKKTRCRELQALAQDMKRQALQTRVGNTYPILWEGQRDEQPDGSIRQYGYTPNYLRVAVDLPAEHADLSATVRSAKIERLENGELLLASLTDD